MNGLDTWAQTVPVIFMGLMGLAMFIYVVLDGFDLGIGLLLPLASDEDKDTMIASIGPFWDANETWLVLGCGHPADCLPQGARHRVDSAVSACGLHADRADVARCGL